MAAGDYLGQYAEGWTKGDAQIITGSLADNYQLDDPNAGMINKQGFAEYLSGMWQVVEGIRGKTSDPLLDITEVVTQEDQGVITAWVWWTVPGTPIQGSGLIKVGDQGVLSERLCYYTKLPEA
ncbi:MAG TPA: nuclear transport factor 2 family protein [Dehalococcoidia bacterium]|jgi:hypothetical protein|nr:nuclear transport factor 2 family protein [Dehalococcoidia bacterium]